MKQAAAAVLAVLLLSGAAEAATPAGKLVFSDSGPLRMKAAKHVAYAWARRDVRNGWAHGYSRPDCQRLSRIRVRCDITQYGLEDSYNPRKCRGENIDPTKDCKKVADSWPFALYISHHYGCVNVWVWNFERIDCWRYVPGTFSQHGR